jgi:Mg2+-importing ATPase
MARDKVIVKRLASIENFGSMNVLCSDKTGTLTEGIVHIHSASDIHGNASDKVLFYAYLNSFYETGFTNPVDEAIRSHKTFDLSGYRQLDEVPYDFVRKRLSILVSKEDRHLMVTKGALKNVLDVCSSAEALDGTISDISKVHGQIQQYYEEFGSKGFRMLGVACRDIGSETAITIDQESNMIFLGFVVIFDPPKPDVAQIVGELKNLGVSLKVITGDNQLVASHLSQEVGLDHPRILTGSDLRGMSDEALLQQVSEVSVFAEVEPNQKERIILSLQKSGNVVGYMGDGINDASALHAADVGISVDGAVDVAKNAADIVLLEKELAVLVKGIREGRTTFANTLKYVFMATSANFGNMFSMAGASLFLPFLPLLPKQILLTNLMTDFPEMTICTDTVDPQMVERPRRWNIRFIRRFMITFGALSSVFDYLTFGVLLLILHATTEQFRTGWFMESVISASMIVLVIRSRKPIFKNRPGKYLLMATLVVAGLTLVFPYTRLGRVFGFTALPTFFLLAMGLIVVLYLFAAEVVKRSFFKRAKF